MAAWLAVWFVVSIVAAMALIACFAGLARHVLVLGRTLRRFQEEIQPIAQDLAREGARVSERAASMEPPRPRSGLSGDRS